jgi:hypothetical protein
MQTKRRSSCRRETAGGQKSKVVGGVEVTDKYEREEYAPGTILLDVTVYGASSDGALIRTNVGVEILMGSEIEVVQRGYSNRAINRRRRRAKKATSDPIGSYIKRYKDDDKAKEKGPSKLISLLQKKGEPFSNPKHRGSLYILQFIEAVKSREMPVEKALRSLPEREGDGVVYGLNCPLS